jgi:hypothetical protein
MAIDQSQNPDDTTSVSDHNNKPAEEKHAEKESQSAADASRVDKERTDTQDGSVNDGSTPRGSDDSAEQVETLGDGIENESATSGSKQQKTKSKSGKGGSADIPSSGNAEPANVENHGKKSNDTLDTPGDGTSPTPGTVDSGDGKDSGFIEEICREVGAIRLFEQVISDPYDPKLRENFSKAVDRRILERQRDIGNTDNLLLSMPAVASLVVKYAKAEEKSGRFRSYAEKQLTEGLKKSYEKKFQQFEQAKRKLKDQWESVLGAKGYPHAWTARLGAKDDKIAIRRELEENSFDSTEELRKQKALACQIWGVSNIEKVDSPEHLSWTIAGQTDEKGSRKRGISPTVESELPPRKK